MTTTKTVFAAFVLAALPTLGFAQCGSNGHEQASMSCADGMVWDKESGTCVTVSG